MHVVYARVYYSHGTVVVVYCFSDTRMYASENMRRGPLNVMRLCATVFELKTIKSTRNKLFFATTL